MAFTGSSPRFGNAVYHRSVRRFVDLLSDLRIDFTQEINKRTFSKFFLRVSELASGVDIKDGWNSMHLINLGGIGLLEGKSIQICDLMWKGDPASHWNPVPTLAFPMSSTTQEVRSKLISVIPRLPYYRLFARQTCGSPATNERSSVFCLVVPGLSAIHSIIAETLPSGRPNSFALETLGIISSFSFDYLVRLQVGPNLSKFILDAIPIPSYPPMTERFLSHSSTRLSSQHEGYAPLWLEQLGDAWREPKPAFTWPVLATDDERWEVRAALDAVVADAYGLDRNQYSHVLSTFSPKSYPKAPALCLVKFDELKQTGLDAFTRQYDPYWDIPLNESLPRPVIELPGSTEAGEAFTLDGLSGKRPKRGGKRR